MTQKMECRRFMTEKLARLAQLPSPAAGAVLAELRRGVAAKPGQLPELWEWTVQGLPEELLGCGGKTTPSELAVYLAMTLYAYHQQGNDIRVRNMQVTGQRFGSAIRKLAAGSGEGGEERIIKRLRAAASTDTVDALGYYLRQIITLLRSQSIGLDYVDLAGDLYDFQYEEGRNAVCLKWARDYYRIAKAEQRDDDNEKREGNDNEV